MSDNELESACETVSKLQMVNDARYQAMIKADVKKTLPILIIATIAVVIFNIILWSI